MMKEILRYTGILSGIIIISFNCLYAETGSGEMEEKMLEVEIVKLKTTYVATFYGYGENPEQTAWDKLLAWAKPKGLLDDPKTHPIYGYNNPPPSKESKKYGYELFILTDHETEPEGDMRVELFYGGVYAVTTCTLDKIHLTWIALYQWAQEQGYEHTYTPGLERAMNSIEDLTDPATFMMELYLPIAKE